MASSDVPGDTAGGANNEPAADSKEPIVVRTTAVDPDRFPDLDVIRSVVLKDGPRVRKEAQHAAIRDRHTGNLHHHQLTIKSTTKRKAGEVEDEKHTVGLSDETDDEIKKLRDFLVAIDSGSVPKETSAVLVVTAPLKGADAKVLHDLLNQATAAGKVDALADVLRRAAHDADLFHALLDRAAADPELFAEAATALNLAAYKNAVEELRALIAAEGVSEGKFQELLTKHPWMFGSGYSQLLERRKWTRDEQQDFVVRRTTDNYIELIEIKTPLGGANLFNYDRSHDCFYAGAELSKVVGQVENYIEKLDADRNSILAQDGEDTCKIRSKVIIGRDGDEHQRRALRRFNGHLHRIEILTFDQLLQITRNVIRYLERALAKAAPEATDGGQGAAGVWQQR